MSHQASLFSEAVDTPWYHWAVEQNRKWDAVARKGSRSNAWFKTALPGELVAKLQFIRDVVSSIVRAHGVDRHCEVDWLTLENAAGCAGFRDAPRSFKEPYICIDSQFLSMKDGSDLVDIYCGIGLHEASHILHTRDFFRADFENEDFFRASWNLWEDERIEQCLRSESPGFAPYIQAVKEHLLYPQIERAMSQWDLLVDMDRVRLLMFAFIRAPHLIDKPLLEWSIMEGTKVFPKLKGLASHLPDTETSAKELAIRFCNFWKAIRGTYPANISEYLQKRFLPCRKNGELRQRLIDQMEADYHENAKKLKSVEKQVEYLCESAAEINDKAGMLPNGREKRELSQLEERLLLFADSLAKDEANKENRPRFCSHTLSNITSWFSASQKGIDRELLSEVNQRKEALGHMWQLMGLPDNQCQPTGVKLEMARGDMQSRSRYELAAKEVSHHTAALKETLRLFSTVDKRVRYRQRSGRLDPKQFARYSVSNALFREEEELKRASHGICLLLDESGSMILGNPRKIDIALQVAALFREACLTFPSIELEIFSHTSPDGESPDCWLRYLYGRRNKDVSALGTYLPKINNYDGVAMRAAGKWLLGNCKAEFRTLILISDGRPSNGEVGVQDAIEAVESLRRSGIRMLNVAIDAMVTDSIFGSENVLHFQNMHSLVFDMRKLLIRILSSTR